LKLPERTTGIGSLPGDTLIASQENRRGVQLPFEGSFEQDPIVAARRQKMIEITCIPASLI
jgi:hypothetical protein